MEHNRKTLSGKQIFAIVGASLAAFIILVAIASALSHSINTKLTAAHSTSTPKTSTNQTLLLHTTAYTSRHRYFLAADSICAQQRQPTGF